MASFDNYAIAYDAHFVNSNIGRAQRNLVHNYLTCLFNKNKTVLEVNCGTGEDAVFLARHFKKLVCADISSEMIKVCESKTKELENVSTLVAPIQKLTINIKDMYDVLFSNFGGLNCLSPNELRDFGKDSVTLLNKNADVVFVIMGRKCLWEKFLFWWQKDKVRANRRLGIGGAATEISGAKFMTYYFSPTEIKQFFQSEYSVEACLPIGFFIPPSYLEDYFKNKRIMFSILVGLEKMVMGLGFLSNYADHYLIHLKRK